MREVYRCTSGHTSGDEFILLNAVRSAIIYVIESSLQYWHISSSHALIRASILRHAEVLMPLYFIDTDDGHFSVRDEDGVEFRDLEAAKAGVMATLPEIFLHRTGADGLFKVTATVRDEAGQVLLRAKLKLSVEQA